MDEPTNVAVSGDEAYLIYLDRLEQHYGITN